MRTTDTWLIQAISNLHAGKGDADFGIIDKHVQRDPVTQLPNIFASSIKGALRELFETNPKLNKDVHKIFGSDAGSNNHLQGSYRFYDARLLALPVRSSHQFYYLATCPEIIQDFLNDLELHSAVDAAHFKKVLSPLANMKVEKGAPLYIGDDDGKIELEEFDATKASTLSQESSDEFQKLLLADRFAIFNGNDFNELCSELPSVARNYLDNGESKNLWYEEIVPRESRFYFFTSSPTPKKDNPSNNNEEEDKIQPLLSNGLKDQSVSSIVQIGANATVGFGLCRISKISA